MSEAADFPVLGVPSSSEEPEGACCDLRPSLGNEEELTKRAAPEAKDWSDETVVRNQELLKYIDRYWLIS